MELTDQERRKFCVYCKHMEEMERQALKAKEGLLGKYAKALAEEMTKRDKLLIVAYHFVAEELEKWDSAETITTKDVSSVNILSGDQEENKDGSH